MSKPRQSSPLSHLLRATLRLGHYLPAPIRRRFHWWLFRRPFQHRRSAEQMAILRQGRAFLVPSGPYLLRGYRFPSSGPTVLLTHGWQGSAASWYRLVPKLLEAGFGVVIFDAPGHSGRPRLATLPVYAQGVSDVEALFGPVYALVGHSFGGMASARVAPTLPHLKALVTLGTPDRVRTLVDGFCRKLGLQGASLLEFEEQLALHSPLPIDKEASSLYIAQVECPTLIFHDQDDEVVPCDEAWDIAQASSRTVRLTKGLGHRAIIRDDAVLDEVVAFLLNPKAAAELPPS